MAELGSEVAAAAIRLREEGETLRIPLGLILGHPDNSNKMGASVYRKLVAAMGMRERYPALIVRPHPEVEGSFQILDGHFRLQALRDVGGVEASCQVWHVDDVEALVLLASLNRLRGRDVPAKRAALVKKIAAQTSLEEVGRRLPETARAIGQLLALADGSTSVKTGTAGSSGVSAFTVFLSPRQRMRLDTRLKAIHANISLAFVMLFDLDEDEDDDGEFGLQGGDGVDGGLEGVGEVSLPEPSGEGSPDDLPGGAQLAE